jgi:hypothetical protein
MAVASRRVRIIVGALVWSDDVIEKLLRKQALEVAEAESILDTGPIFIENAPSATRVATHAILGRSAHGHAIAIYVSETAEPDVWYVHTAHRSRTASRLLRLEGGPDEPQTI